VVLHLSIFICAVAATWRRPVYGLALLIAIVPFALSRDIGHTTITLPKVALLAVALGLLLGRSSFTVLREKPVLKLLVAALVIAAVTALSYAQAQYKEPVLRETFKALEYALAFAVAALCYRADADERIVRNALFAIGAIVSVLALAQEFTGAPSAIIVSGHIVPRIAGPLEGPNQLAGYLGLLLPVMVAFALRQRAGAPGWAAILLCVAALVLTFSRAGVFCAVVAVAIVFAVDRRRENLRSASVLVAAIVAALAAAVLAGGELSRFWSTGGRLEANGLGTRGELWTAAYRLWLRHPWLGIGAGNYELELSAGGFPELHTHANSGYIQALVEGGIPGVFAVLWMVWLSISTFVRARTGAPLVAGILGAMAGFALHEVFDCLLFYPKVGLMFWLLLGVGAAAVASSVDEQKMSRVQGA
jgi:O-antigen ligase